MSSQELREKRRILLLILIMTAVSVGVGGIVLYVLYETAFAQQRLRLVETVQSQARLIEAVARFDIKHSSEDVPGGAFAATLGQIREANKHFRGFGETVEFSLAKREGDKMVFLLSHRNNDLENPEPVSFSSALAEPMRRALSGESGTVVGLDYRGETVLAAYQMVSVLDLGIVAKLDIKEIWAPFIKAGLAAGAGAMVLILLGTVVFRRVTNPLLQHLEESERKYRTLFSTASEGVYLTSDVVEECNDQMCRMLGCERQDFVGSELVKFSPPRQPDGRSSEDVARVRFEAALSGTPQFFHWQYRRKDGVLIDADISLKAIELGDRTMLLAAARDVTARHQAEMERERLLAELEARNADLDQLVYTVSHDLKSPLITILILGFVDFLEKDSIAGNAARLKQDIEQIHTATKQMQRMMDELLELSRIGQLAYSPREVSLDLDLDELAREAVALVGGRIAKRGVQVEISPGLPDVSGDRTRLLRIFQNLIENAVKFMGSQPAPRVEIGGRKVGEEIVCYVKDNGVGIDPRHHEKIFGLFNKLDQEHEGTGIGLALVKRVLDVHGGRIWIESEGQGRGCTFSFALPLKRESDYGRQSSGIIFDDPAR